MLARDFQGYFRPLLERYGYLHLLKPDPALPNDAVTTEFMVDNTRLVGRVKDVARKIRKLYEAVGGFGVLLALAHEWQPRDKWIRSQTLLAQEVLPRVADPR